jgi:hypothetical protein
MNAVKLGIVVIEKQQFITNSLPSPKNLKTNQYNIKSHSL